MTGIALVHLLLGVVPAALALVNKRLFDLFTGNLVADESSASLAPTIGMYAAVVVLGSLLPVGLGLLETQHRIEVRRAGSRLMTRLLGATGRIDVFENPSTHSKISLAFDGAERAGAQAVMSSMQLAESTVAFLSLGAVLFLLGPVLAFVVLLAAVLRTVISVVSASLAVDAEVRMAPLERRASYLRHLMSDPQPVRELKAAVAEPRVRKRYLSAFDASAAIEMFLARKVSRWNFGTAMVGSFSTVLIVAVTSVNVSSGESTVGDLALLISASVSLQAAFGQLGESIGIYSESRLTYDHLRQAAMTLRASDEYVEVDEYREACDIEFRNVTFRYAAELPEVLRNVSFTIGAGTSTAIVGVNGAGKSTIVKLIAGLRVPDQGDVLVGGVNTRNANPELLRSRMAIMFQDYNRFDFSIAENIDLVNDVPSMDVPILDEIGVSSFVDKLPDGFLTELTLMHGDGETGVDLSGGQWQRLALARALHGGRPVTILDEPTAALDPQSEVEVIDAIERFFSSGRTGLFITHRLPIIRLADQVVVLDDGEVVEAGPPARLLSARGAYWKTFAGQQLALERLGRDRSPSGIAEPE